MIPSSPTSYTLHTLVHIKPSIFHAAFSYSSPPSKPFLPSTFFSLPFNRPADLNCMDTVGSHELDILWKWFDIAPTLRCVFIRWVQGGLFLHRGRLEGYPPSTFPLPLPLPYIFRFIPPEPIAQMSRSLLHSKQTPRSLFPTIQNLTAWGTPPRLPPSPSPSSGFGGILVANRQRTHYRRHQLPRLWW